MICRKNSKSEVRGAWPYAAGIVVILAICGNRDAIWRDLRRDDFSVLVQGTYRGHPQYMQHPGAYETAVKKCRQEIEKNRDLFNAITGRFFDIKGDLNYQYKFTSVDSAAQCLILRYFARIPNDRIYAGYQIQFVYSMKERRFAVIFTDRVPLE